MVNFTTYEQQLKENLQNVLRSKGLVDTGTLVNSVDVSITEDFQVVISSEDYLVYLEEDNQALNEFYNSTITENILEQAYEAYLLNKIEE